MDIEEAKKIKVGDNVIEVVDGFKKTYKVVGTGENFFALSKEYIKGMPGECKVLKIIKFDNNNGLENLKLKLKGA